MNDTIDLTKINDIQELKALKADQYDKLSNANAEAQLATTNIQAINGRISQVESGLSATKMKEVDLEVSPAKDK